MEDGREAQTDFFANGDVTLNPAGLDTSPTWSRETELVLFAADPSLLNRTAQQIGRSATVKLVPRYPTSGALLHYLAPTLAAEFEHDGPPDLLYAQSLAAFEAVAGVLYTVILLSRLVGMHQSGLA